MTDKLILVVTEEATDAQIEAAMSPLCRSVFEDDSAKVKAAFEVENVQLLTRPDGDPILAASEEAASLLKGTGPMLPDGYGKKTAKVSEFFESVEAYAEFMGYTVNDYGIGRYRGEGVFTSYSNQHQHLTSEIIHDLTNIERFDAVVVDGVILAREGESDDEWTTRVLENILDLADTHEVSVVVGYD